MDSCIYSVTAVLAYYSVILRNGVLIYSLHEAGPRHLDHATKEEAMQIQTFT